jgi:hypothetical protein
LDDRPSTCLFHPTHHTGISSSSAANTFDQVMFDLLHNTYGGKNNPSHASHFDAATGPFFTETRLVLNQGYTAQDLNDNLFTKKATNSKSHKYSENSKDLVRRCLRWDARVRQELECPRARPKQGLVV